MDAGSLGHDHPSIKTKSHGIEILIELASLPKYRADELLQKHEGDVSKCLREQYEEPREEEDKVMTNTMFICVNIYYIS